MAGAALVLLVTPGPATLTLQGVDGTLLLFFAALFVVTFGVSEAGIAERLYLALQPLFGSTPGHQIVRFGAFAVAGVQLVSNVPFVLLAARWIPQMADPHLSWLALALTTHAGGKSDARRVGCEPDRAGASPGDKGRIPFLRFVRTGVLATFLPLLTGMSTLWIERAAGFLK